MTCLLRPWVFNISTTIMFAPLIMKLHRVDRLVNNPRLKKIKITDFTVFLQVLGILFFDIVLLIIWTFTNRPRLLIKSTNKYVNVMEPIDDLICSTGLSNIMEILFVVYKAGLLAFGVFKAVATWNVPADLSEAKYFAVAIYNITMIGGLSYFLSDFLGSTTSVYAGVSLLLNLFYFSLINLLLFIDIITMFRIIYLFNISSCCHYYPKIISNRRLQSDTSEYKIRIGLRNDNWSCI